jgi:hypothetical protein
MQGLFPRLLGSPGRGSITDHHSRIKPRIMVRAVPCELHIKAINQVTISWSSRDLENWNRNGIRISHRHNNSFYWTILISLCPTLPRGESDRRLLTFVACAPSTWFGSCRSRLASSLNWGAVYPRIHPIYEVPTSVLRITSTWNLPKTFHSNRIHTAAQQLLMSMVWSMRLPDTWW